MTIRHSNNLDLKSRVNNSSFSYVYRIDPKEHLYDMVSKHHVVFEDKQSNRNSIKRRYGTYNNLRLALTNIYTLDTKREQMLSRVRLARIHAGSVKNEAEYIVGELINSDLSTILKEIVRILSEHPFSKTNMPIAS